MFSTSAKYTSYSYLNNTKIISHNKIINGVISGVASTLITHPIDVIKIHMQMSKPFLPELKLYGLPIFYRGYSKSFSKICISSALFFPLYDYINNILMVKIGTNNPSIDSFGKNFCYEETKIHQQYNSINKSLIASFFSATISTIIMHPIDFLKVRHVYNQPLYIGYNLILYYKGLSLNLTRIVPHFMIVMTMIDFFNKNKLIKK